MAANNFRYKAAVANIALDARGEELQLIVIADLSEAGCLDLNPPLQSQAMKFPVALFLPVPSLVLVVGAPTVSRIFMKIVRACVPEDFKRNIVSVSQRKDIEKYIRPSDTPSWWYDADSQTRGVPQCPHDPRTTWQYTERLRKGFSVTLAELWNPGPWLDSVEDRRLPPSKEVENGLGTFDEDPEDEW